MIDYKEVTDGGGSSRPLPLMIVNAYSFVESTTGFKHIGATLEKAGQELIFDEYKKRGIELLDLVQEEIEKEKYDEWRDQQDAVRSKINNGVVP